MKDTRIVLIGLQMLCLSLSLSVVEACPFIARAWDGRREGNISVGRGGAVLGNEPRRSISRRRPRYVAKQSRGIIVIADTPADAHRPQRAFIMPGWLGSRARSLHHIRGRRREMLYTLAVILLIAWLLGIVGTYTIGAFIHVLLVVAIVLFLVGLLSGRRTVV